MQSVRMHTDGNGVSWAMAKCSVYGEVHKYLTENRTRGPCRLSELPPQDGFGSRVDRNRRAETDAGWRRATTAPSLAMTRYAI